MFLLHSDQTLYPPNDIFFFSQLFRLSWWINHFVPLAEGPDPTCRILQLKNHCKVFITFYNKLVCFIKGYRSNNKLIVFTFTIHQLWTSKSKSTENVSLWVTSIPLRMWVMTRRYHLTDAHGLSKSACRNVWKSPNPDVSGWCRHIQTVAGSCKYTLPQCTDSWD